MTSRFCLHYLHSFQSQIYHNLFIKSWVDVGRMIATIPFTKHSSIKFHRNHKPIWQNPTISALFWSPPSRLQNIVLLTLYSTAIIKQYDKPHDECTLLRRKARNYGKISIWWGNTHKIWLIVLLTTSFSANHATEILSASYFSNNC